LIKDFNINNYTMANFFNKKDKQLAEQHKSILETIKLDLEEMHTKYETKWIEKSENWRSNNDAIEDQVANLNDAAEAAQTAYDELETFLAGEE
jgi:hypothetical protein